MPEPESKPESESKPEAEPEPEAQPELEPKPAKVPEPGPVFKDCPSCPEMVTIPPGSFRMGDLTGKGPGAEQPAREVEVSTPFAIGKYEVTAGQFAKFIIATGREQEGGCWTFEEGAWEKDKGKSWRSPGFPQTASNPLVCVSWNDAQAYVAWIAKETGKAYRLPTEAEWEYAARAGTKGIYHFGGGVKELCGYANGADSSTPVDWRNQSCNDNWSDVAPVGSLKPNAFGLHDMHGNVWEWVEDCWNIDHEDAPDDTAARKKKNCKERVMRGGSWLGR
ncbi:MAG: SUMF1/EgtB/PvdO family nonheme iron enzyme, partial [Rhodospirillales bacterium]|nr:SUMF1/EgtB/PvdO family nonheme iron enzyme [Rhodospirillales bacterium]